MKYISKNLLIIYIILCFIIAAIFLYVSGILSNDIKVGDKVRCGDLFTYQYDLEVLYKDGDYIYGSGTETYMEIVPEFFTDEKGARTPNLEKHSEIKNSIRNIDAAFNIKQYECFRLDMDGIAIDRIRIAKEQSKE